MYAASVANVEMVRFLLDRGANASFNKGKMLEKIWLCFVLWFFDFHARVRLNEKIKYFKQKSTSYIL